MEEIVSKQKLKTYFEQFILYNPLLHDEELNTQRIDYWIRSRIFNSENEKSQDCVNEVVGICSNDEVKDIEFDNDLNNENQDNEQPNDTVLDTFYQKKTKEIK